MSRQVPPATEVLRRVPLFARLGDEELARLGNATARVTYRRNQTVFSANDPGDALYVVLSGQVKVVLLGPDGREAILAMLRDGDWFGELALLDDQPRSAHVVAMQESTLAVLRREDFQACVLERPAITIALLRELSSRLRQTDRHIKGLALLAVEARLAGALLSLADRKDGRTISPRPSHRTLGQVVGATRETVTRTMRRMVQRRLITLAGNKLELLDRPALEAMAERRRPGRQRH